MENRILVIRKDGGVFGHAVDGNMISPAAHLPGSKVAWRQEDRWVVTMGNRVLVIVNDGAVFAHDVAGNKIGPGYQLL
jgi:hypothetical protein